MEDICVCGSEVPGGTNVSPSQSCSCSGHPDVFQLTARRLQRWTCCEEVSPELVFVITLIFHVQPKT